MRNYVIINGVNSNTINGLAINELPPITKPPMRVLQEEIDGRDGDITTNLGYGAYDKVMTIGLFHTFDINQIIAFFNGSGTIVFSNEPDKKYNYKIIDQIDYEKLINFKTATVTLHCQPFKYPLEETPLIIEPTTETLENVTSASIETDENTLSTTLKGNTSQDTTTQGKNMFDGSTMQINKNINGEGVYGDYNGCCASERYINVNPSTTYTFSCNITSYQLRVNKYTSDKTSIERIYQTGGVFTFTTDSNCYYVRLSLYASNSELSSDFLNDKQFQLEQGSSATSYEAFVPDSPSPDYPSPVNVVTGDNEVVVCGKNLFDIGTDLTTDYFITTSNGKYINTTISVSSRFTGSITNNSIVITNTITTNYPWLSKFIKLEKNTQYTIQLQSSSALSPTPIICGANSNTQGTTGTQLGSLSNNVLTFNSGEYDYYWLAIYFGANSNTISNIQIEKRNSSTSYEPYQSQTYPIYLPVENLIGLDTNQYQVNLKAGDKITAKNTTSSSLTLNLYTNYGDTTRNDYWTIGSNATRTIIVAYNTKAIAWNSNVASGGYAWINYGDNINAYYPYGTTPIELCKIGDYQDYIYKDNGTWYLHKEIGKVVLDGTENWQVNGTGTANWFYYYYNGISPKISDGFSNYFTYTPIGSTTTDIGFFLSNNYMRVRTTSEDTTTNFKTWLSNNNTIVYYVLATPTNTIITDTTLISQLEALKGANSYYGVTNINQDNSDLPFMLDITYFKKDTNKVILNNIGNIYSKPTIALEGNGTGGIYLNGNQVFNVTLTDKMTISTKDMEAYNPDTHALLNRAVTGNYNSMTLQPSNNTIKVTGGITKATITDYTRWL